MLGLAHAGREGPEGPLGAADEQEGPRSAAAGRRLWALLVAALPDDLFGGHHIRLGESSIGARVSSMLRVLEFFCVYRGSVGIKKAGVCHEEDEPSMVESEMAACVTPGDRRTTARRKHSSASSTPTSAHFPLLCAWCAEAYGAQTVALLRPRARTAASKLGESELEDAHHPPLGVALGGDQREASESICVCV